MRYLLFAIALVPLMPNMALAQSWQDWVRQNPTYPSLEPKPAPSTPTTAPVPSAPAPVPNVPAPAPFPTNTQAGNSTQSPEFVNGFMNGCTQSGGVQQKSYCACALQKVQNHFTAQQVVNIANRYTRTGVFSEDFINKVIRPCAELVVR